MTPYDTLWYRRRVQGLGRLAGDGRRLRAAAPELPAAVRRPERRGQGLLPRVGRGGWVGSRGGGSGSGSGSEWVCVCVCVPGGVCVSPGVCVCSDGRRRRRAADDAAAAAAAAAAALCLLLARDATVIPFYRHAVVLYERLSLDEWSNIFIGATRLHHMKPRKTMREFIAPGAACVNSESDQFVAAINSTIHLCGRLASRGVTKWMRVRARDGYGRVGSRRRGRPPDIVVA